MNISTLAEKSNFVQTTQLLKLFKKKSKVKKERSSFFRQITGSKMLTIPYMGHNASRICSSQK